MRLKIFNLFLLIIVVVCSCKTDSPPISDLSEDTLEQAYNKTLAETNRESSNYIPDWEKKQEHNGEIYVPIKARQEVSAVSNGKKWIPNDNNVWLKGKIEKGIWQFSLLNIYPNNRLNISESGVIVYEDLKTHKLTYSDYKNGQLYTIVSKKATTSSTNCTRQVVSWVCAGEVEVMECSPRYGLVCPPNPADYPNDPNIPPINGGGGPIGGGTGGDNGYQRYFPDPSYGSVPNPPYIVDNTLDKCIRAAVKTLVESNVRNASGQVLLELFKQSADFNLIFNESYELDPLVGGQAWTKNPTIVNGQVTKMDVVIDLNANTLPKASREYTAVVVLHEAIHAYLYTKKFFNTTLAQHDAMWASYIDVMATYLNTNYGMDINEAKVLATEGLQNTFQSKIEDRIYNNLKNGLNYPSNQRATLIQAYRNGTKGQSCK